MATYRKKRTQMMEDKPAFREVGGRVYTEEDYGWGPTLVDTGAVGGSRTGYEKAAEALLGAQEARGRAEQKYPEAELSAGKQSASIEMGRKASDLLSQKQMTEADLQNRKLFAENFKSTRDYNLETKKVGQSGIELNLASQKQASDIEMTEKLMEDKFDLNKLSSQAMRKELGLPMSEETFLSSFGGSQDLAPLATKANKGMTSNPVASTAISKMLDSLLQQPKKKKGAITEEEAYAPYKYLESIIPKLSFGEF